MPISPAQAMRQNPGKTGGAVAAIAAALLAVYVNEGGFVDDKLDRGGATNFGITERVARKWGYRGSMRDFPKHCTPTKPVCADHIYQTDYIDKPGFKPFATLEPAILEEIVDSGVVHGPSRPSRWLQIAVNAECGSKLKVDGQVGPATIGAFAGCQATQKPVSLCIRMLDRMDNAQWAFFNAIVAYNPSQHRFLKGWRNHRVGNVNRKKCGSGLV